MAQHNTQYNEVVWRFIKIMIVISVWNEYNLRPNTRSSGPATKLQISRMSGMNASETFIALDFSPCQEPATSCFHEIDVAIACPETDSHVVEL